MGRLSAVAGLAALVACGSLGACGSRGERPRAGGDAGPSGARTGIGFPAAPPARREPADIDEAPAVCAIRGQDPDAVLDEASRLLYDAGDFKAALGCAELAVDLVPQAVEAHHYRAAALAALGRYSEAQVAFAMALARDPDDPETLAAAADFYINIAQPKQRSAILLGLEYARRGSGRAASRRRLDRQLRARLSLLEAEALNDLGQSDAALPRVDAALKLTPQNAAALHERGVSLFSLCRFADAETAFAEVLREQPDDPYAHYHLGLILERYGREAEAEERFTKARALASDDFPPPVKITAEEFRAEVDRAIAEQAPEVRRELAKVALELVDLPAQEDLIAVDPPFAPTIMGLYRGLPLAQTGPTAADEEPIPPRAIVLYRKNLARAVRSRDELDRQIRRTLIHEIGHLQGLDEDDLRRRGLE
ncbi:MAG TPA: metallopeptidase family protein [Kofleriaceae bacterium]|nr:metallopeptidase family protein [Kofleriaceae bacterium]